MEDEEFEVVGTTDGIEGRVSDRAKIKVFPGWPYSRNVPSGPEKKVQDFFSAIRADIGPNATFKFQRNLAEKMGIDEGLLSRYLNGQTAAPLDFVAQVEAAFGRQMWPQHDAERHEP